jgi:hypothetical protein
MLKRRVGGGERGRRESPQIRSKRDRVRHPRAMLRRGTSAGRSSQQKYDELMKSWHRRNRALFMILGLVCGSIIVASCVASRGVPVVDPGPVRWRSWRLLHDRTVERTRVDRELAAGSPGREVHGKGAPAAREGRLGGAA